VRCGVWRQAFTRVLTRAVRLVRQRLAGGWNKEPFLHESGSGWEREQDPWRAFSTLAEAGDDRARDLADGEEAVETPYWPDRAALFA
jgi:hypothetical protein